MQDCMGLLLIVDQIVSTMNQLSGMLVVTTGCVSSVFIIINMLNNMFWIHFVRILGEARLSVGERLRRVKVIHGTLYLLQFLKLHSFWMLRVVCVYCKKFKNLFKVF